MRTRAYLFLLLAMSGCGGSSSDPIERGGDPTKPPSSTNETSPPPANTPPVDLAPGSTACVTATRDLCARALGCSGAAQTVIIAYGTSATEQHDSLSECENFYQYLVCADATKAAPYNADCRNAVGSATCVATTKGTAVSFPAACGKK